MQCAAQVNVLIYPGYVKMSIKQVSHNLLAAVWRVEG